MNNHSFQVLVKHGANMDRSSVIPGKYTTSPMYCCMNSNYLRCFRFLLMSGADPDYHCTKFRLIYKHVRGFQSLYYTAIEKNFKSEENFKKV